MAILLISFDAVGDLAFEAMAADAASYPNIAAFRERSRFRGGIRTAFVSNTYPVHAAVATGRPPGVHGIVSNFLPPGPGGERPWAQMAKLIKAKTIWDAAREKGLTTAALLWPVTCGAKIDFHMPEVHPRKGQNLLLGSLRYGSVFFQLGALARHGRKLAAGLKGPGQPSLDDFTVSATCDLLRRKKPDLTLVHLIAYDTLFHRSGSRGEGIETARLSLDRNLGRLLESWGEGTVVVFSDHSQLDVGENIDLREIFGDAVCEQAGGCAFVHGPAAGIEDRPWFGRLLSPAEMEESGYAGRGLTGIAAKPGHAFCEEGGYRGAHGYPCDYENYAVFYAVRGRGFTPDPDDAVQGPPGRITDVTAIIAQELGLDMNLPEAPKAGTAVEG